MPRLLVMVSAKHIVDKGNEVVWYKEPIYVKKTISSDHLKELKEVAHKILNNPEPSENVNDSLAGNIEKEFSLGESQKILEPYASSLANFYLKFRDNNYYDKLPRFDNQYRDTDLESFYSFDEAWINFQKKYEFNPVHHHAGDFSYVLWIQIPFDLEEEMSLSNCVNSNTPSNSIFNFSLTNISGQLVEYSLMIDKSWEGTMVLFPAKMPHQVYPFYTSDDYRISISGNIKRIKKPQKRSSFDYS